MRKLAWRIADHGRQAVRFPYWSSLPKPHDPDRAERPASGERVCVRWADAWFKSREVLVNALSVRSDPVGHPIRGDSYRETPFSESGRFQTPKPLHLQHEHGLIVVGCGAEFVELAEAGGIQIGGRLRGVRLTPVIVVSSSRLCMIRWPPDAASTISYLPFHAVINALPRRIPASAPRRRQKGWHLPDSVAEAVGEFQEPRPSGRSGWQGVPTAAPAPARRMRPTRGACGTRPIVRLKV